MTPKLVRRYYTIITRMEEIVDTSFRTSFIKLLEQRKDYTLNIAEIGVWEGVNSQFMLLANSNIKLYLIDDWSNCTIYTGGPVVEKAYSDNIKSIAQFNLRDYKNAEFVMKNSEHAVTDFVDDFFDYVYIDGDHSYEAVKRDLRLWYPKVKYGGIFGGHDVAMTEVSTALEEFVKEKKIKNYFKDELKDGRSDWWIFK